MIVGSKQLMLNAMEWFEMPGFLKFLHKCELDNNINAISMYDQTLVTRFLLL